MVVHRDHVYASLFARLFGMSATDAAWLGSPAVVFSAWAAFGHLITLDDDYPGEWSNPEQEETVWRRSLKELVVKFLVFALAAVIVLFPLVGAAMVAG